MYTILGVYYLLHYDVDRIASPFWHYWCKLAITAIWCVSNFIRNVYVQSVLQTDVQTPDVDTSKWYSKHSLLRERDVKNRRRRSRLGVASRLIYLVAQKGRGFSATSPLYRQVFAALKYHRRAGGLSGRLPRARINFTGKQTATYTLELGRPDVPVYRDTSPAVPLFTVVYFGYLNGI